MDKLLLQKISEQTNIINKKSSEGGELRHLCRLPHPQRILVSKYLEFHEKIFDSSLIKLIQLFQEPNISKMKILTEIDQHPDGWTALELYEQHEKSNYIPSRNKFIQHFVLTLLRFRHGNGVVFQTNNYLDATLCETDIKGKCPSKLLRLPYPIIYIECSERRENPYRLTDEETGEHVFEGAYLTQNYITDTNRSDFEQYENSICYYTDIELKKIVRIIDIDIIGSSIGKENISDDTIKSFTIAIDDEEQSIDQLLSRHVPYWTSPASGLFPANTSEHENFEKIVLHLAKILLYVNMRDYEFRKINAVDALKKQIKKASSFKAKQKKLKKDSLSVYDRIQLGPTHSNELDQQLMKLNRKGIKPH